MLGRRIAAPTTALAIENIARDPTRMRGTVAALMVAFAMVLIVSTFIHSMRTSILSWVDQTFAADLWVSRTAQLDLPSGPTLSGTLEPRLRSIPGVVAISPSRMINARIGDTLAVLRTESAEGFARQHYPLLAGDVASLEERFQQGDVLVSDNFAYRHGVHAGDSLSLATPSGTAMLRSPRSYSTIRSTSGRSSSNAKRTAGSGTTISSTASDSGSRPTPTSLGSDGRSPTRRDRNSAPSF